MAATAFRYLSQEDVVAAGGLDMAAIVDVIERAFRVKAEGQVFMPPKVMISGATSPAPRRSTAASWPCRPTSAASSTWPG
jgi:ornithine cyclodeaminase/alanine dehydrogenase-like protein (mu-crystallin family)